MWSVESGESFDGAPDSCQFPMMVNVSTEFESPPSPGEEPDFPETEPIRSPPNPGQEPPWPGSPPDPGREPDFPEE
jgi:hypothetical protein